MKVIIAGSRDFRSYDLLKQKCDEILLERDEVEIVSGTARGADKMGEFYASERGYSMKLFPADWDQYGKSAGYIRNKQMAEYANMLICFWDGQSKGTQHMINLAKDLGLEVHIIRF
jgi:ABC-type enterochelin transport system substrate-binding protein